MTLHILINKSAIMAPVEHSKGLKRGRPRIYPIDVSRPQSVTVKLDIELLNEIDEIAEREDRDRTEIIRYLLKEALAARATFQSAA